jgi:hypothetical protein
MSNPLSPQLGGLVVCGPAHLVRSILNPNSCVAPVKPDKDEDGHLPQSTPSSSRSNLRMTASQNHAVPVSGNHVTLKPDKGEDSPHSQPQAAHNRSVLRH